MKGSSKRLVFQGVHMLFDANAFRPRMGRRSADEHPPLKVFIGKNLDRRALTEEGFKSCLAWDCAATDTPPAPPGVC